jgi:alkylation response protein AidB-like acyl-CoA dehydrogenase
MDLFPDADQQQIVETVDDFCRRRFPMETVRAQAGRPQSVEDGDWRALAELGCFGLGLPADLGGTDSGVVGELLVIRELARHLVPGPAIPTILAAHVLSGADPDTAAQIAEGAVRVALAQPVARKDDGPQRYLVSDLGDGLVLVADGDHWSVYPGTACSDVTAVRALDPSTRLATATLAGEPLADVRDTALRSRAHVLVAAAMCGVASATTTASTSYAKDRTQFGQPIGSFQAVKHRCAEMAVRTEAAFSQTVYAGLVFDEGGADAEFQAAAARLIATTAAGDNCADNIQNHGGIGFTEECDAHLYLRRWRALERTLGDRFSVADSLATLLAAQ